MKTPDEIKMGLVEAMEETSWVVEGGDAHDLQDACDMAHASMADALAYIRQLEAERDAAVKDVSLFPDCGTCKYNPRKKGYIPNDCDDCVNHCNWQWRGIQKEG